MANKASDMKSRKKVNFEGVFDEESSNQSMEEVEETNSLQEYDGELSDEGIQTLKNFRTSFVEPTIKMDSNFNNKMLKEERNAPIYIDLDQKIDRFIGRIVEP